MVQSINRQASKNIRYVKSSIWCSAYGTVSILSILRETFFNTLGPIQGGRHFADDIFKCIFLNEKFLISNEISSKYVPYGLIDNNT